MSLESATYINGLVPANPLGSDPLADADGHLRLLKSTLKATFPNITGPVTATQATLNNPFPVGGIIMWSGATVPSGWFLCDGNNGTPNLKDRFIIGSGGSFATGATGGSTTISAANLPAHTHTYSGTTSGHSNDHSHAIYISDPGHVHSPLYLAGGSAGAGNGAAWNQLPYDNGGSGFYNHGGTASATTGISASSGGASANHTHTFSGTTSSVGSGTAYYPPYFALAFIMKGAY